MRSAKQTTGRMVDDGAVRQGARQVGALSSPLAELQRGG